ncbi:unnamed protein product [Didymodactylos carnosus]|uniref:Uncharacterized protein n=1 Tax=Didymodactylos carnosus TaxID=1234261 RepID=A0A814IT49_9BILA|nr:unnamed protein product [Didymodactylos carnosus]CAF3797954.1 unnamed protein product [Didymodactylos carnosus]
MVSDSSDNFFMYNVTFDSSENVTSGKIKLFGTILIPIEATISNPVPGCLLIHGSGGNDRWEDIENNYHLFYDIATYLASNGIAVLVYDKRNCRLPICQYQFCNISPINDTDNCVQSLKLTMFDYVSDAEQAFKFLANYSQTINSKRLIIGGHSEEQLQYLQSQVPVTPQIEQAIEQLIEIINMLNCTTLITENQYNLIRSQSVPIDFNSVICYGGHTYPQFTFPNLNLTVEKGFYCPAQCGTNVCSPHMNSDYCLLLCQIGYFNYDICLSTAYAYSQLKIGYLINDTNVALQNLSILIVNSQSDLKTPPSVYQPLHHLLKQVYERESKLQLLSIQEINELNHYMTIGTETQVAPIVTNTALKFLIDQNILLTKNIADINRNCSLLSILCLVNYFYIKSKR